MNSTELAASVAEACHSLKAIDTQIIDIRKRCGYADFFIVASGSSSRHVVGIAEHIQTTLKDCGERALGVEGLLEGQWVLLDYGSVIVHIFHEYTRSVYQLETLWQSPAQLSAARV